MIARDTYPSCRALRERRHDEVLERGAAGQAKLQGFIVVIPVR